MDLSRRTALSILSCAVGRGETSGPKSLARYLSSPNGAAVLLEVSSGRLLAVNDEALASSAASPPGSTIKPFVLYSLLRRSKLRADISFLCPRQLRIAGRNFDCTHPVVSGPLRVDEALAYSCNCFVARMAERFEPGQLAEDLSGFGLLVDGASGPLMALGEGGVRVTTLGLARAYRRLALDAGSPQMAPILEGLDGSVRYGTGQAAQVPGMAVAGKTGSAGSGTNRTALFAGFMPARGAKVVVAVMLRGRSGGADAAPVAGEILMAYSKGRP